MDRKKYEHQNLENEAAFLWEDICDESRVDRFHKKIVQHSKSVLYGFATVTLVVKTASGILFPIKLSGLAVKSLKGKPRIDMPSEKGADGEWYDHFMPRSGAGRAALTTFVFSDPEVQEAIAEAAAAAQEADESGNAEAEVTAEIQGEQPELRAGNPFAAQA